MIGFFGDSYIDANSKEKPSWPTMVSDSLNKTSDYYGMSGTSHWYSYEIFLKNYKKYNTIVFSHTSHGRWPHLPNAEIGHHWQIGHRIGYPSLRTSDLLKKLNSVYHDIFSDDLLNFLCGNIFKSINEICRDNNIHLINIFPFETKYDTTTDFVNIFNIDKISWKEEMKYDNKKYIICKWLSNQQKLDPRCCHLNERNNIIFSKIITDLICDKVKNQSIDALTYDWEYYDPNLDSELGKQK